MKGIFAFRGLWACVAAGLAAAGAAGLGPPGPHPERTVAVVDVSPSARPPDPLPEAARPFDDSRIGAALREAAAAGAGRIVLYTDGCDPSGAAPAGPGVPVDVVLLPRRDDVGLLDLRGPARVPLGTDFAVRIAVGRTAGPEAPPARAVVRLWRDGERVGGDLEVRLRRGETRHLLVRDRVDGGGLVRYRARLRGPGHPGNDEREAVVRAGDRPFVLAVDAARPEGFEGVEKAPGEVEKFLADAAARSAVDAVLLGGTLASEGAQEAVARTVEAGAGLVVLGGGGFAGGPLERVLPLTDRPPGGRAALLLLDFSGSMQPRKTELLAAVERLLERFAPEDRAAYLVFRDRVVARSEWTAARDARWDLQAVQPRGNTLLLPALEGARDLLLRAGAARRRLFVVSDGEWKDPSRSELGAILRELAGDGVFCAALVVKDEVDPTVRALFPNAFRAGADLSEDLARMEDAAPDRTVPGPVTASPGRAPPWLDGAVPPPGEYTAVRRLYPKGEGEDIALRAGDVPLVGAWRRGGKVVVVAPDAARNAAVSAAVADLVQACVPAAGPVRLDARREGAALVIEVWGGAGAPLLVEGDRVPVRPAGPGYGRATVDPAPEGAILLSCGPAALLVPPDTDRELAGLGNRPDVAAAVARASGGRLLRDGGPRGPEATGMSASLTLLAAAACVLVSALRRRKT